MGSTSTVKYPIFLWQWGIGGNTAKFRRIVYSTVGCNVLTPDPGDILRLVTIRFKNRCIRHQSLQSRALRQHVLLTAHITSLKLQIRNLEVAIVWHCEQVIEESTVNQWCTLFLSDISLAAPFLIRTFSHEIFSCQDFSSLGPEK